MIQELKISNGFRKITEILQLFMHMPKIKYESIKNTSEKNSDREQ